MKIVKIPTKYSITVDGKELLEKDSKRVLLSVSWGGGIFESASAQIQIFEPIPAIMSMPSFGGIWTINVDGKLRFKGFLDNVKKDRSLGGNIFTFTLRSVLSAWDMLLTNTSFGDSTTSASVKLNPATMGTYLKYLVDTAEQLSGVAYDKPLPTNNMPFSDLYQDGVLSVTNSTYLAEIQKACQNLGYAIFAEPTGIIRIIDVLHPPTTQPIFTAYLHPDENLGAGFTTNLSSIPATVLVADDISQVGVAYGYKEAGAPHDDRNYNITKLNNIVFAVTTGIKPEKLPDIAHQIFNISRQASQKLSFRVAMLLEAQKVLGYPVGWTDSANNYGTYIIQKYTTTITPQELYTEIEGYTLWV